MAKFYYIVRDKTGQKINSSEEAPSEEELINRLQAKNFTVLNVFTELKESSASKAAVAGQKVGFKPRHHGISGNDLALFCRQLATLLGAGVTILKSLDIISKQVASHRLYEVIRQMQKNMEEGLSLHEAMAKHKRVFSDLWVNLVESGEASGNLAVVLNRLAGYLERNAAFVNKIISALIYPMILFVAGLGALLFLTLRIIPVFADLFKGFNITLPFLTRMLITTSTFLQKMSLIILMGIVVAIFLIRNFIRTKEGRVLYEEFMFRMPILGDFFRALIVERLSSEMTTLIESGVPILYSLEITEQSVGSVIMTKILKEVKEEVRSGRPLHQPLEKSGFFEPMVIQMVTIGEEIGELSQMFKKINVFYQDEVERFLVRFTALFEPLILVFIGAVIGIMIVGMFLPIFQIASIGG